MTPCLDFVTMHLRPRPSRGTGDLLTWLMHNGTGAWECFQLRTIFYANYRELPTLIEKNELLLPKAGKIRF